MLDGSFGPCLIVWIALEDVAVFSVVGAFLNTQMVGAWSLHGSSLLQSAIETLGSVYTE